MMLPRLILARTLLADNGAIFVSIDDNEVHHLRNIMNEVFGEENFVCQIASQSRQSMQNDTDISVNHEYVVVYAKLRRLSDRRLKEANAGKWYTAPGFAAYPLPLKPERFSNPDDDPRGPWKADPFDAPNIRPNLTYAILNPNTGEAHWPPPGRCWRTEESSFKALLADNRIVFGKFGETRPQLKVFYEEKKEFGEVENTWFGGATHGTATQGTREIQELFGGEAVFSSPKPTSLIKALLRLASRNDDLVLDFFAGSGSTGHAVAALNLEDGSHRRFILIQWPERTPVDSTAYNAGYKTIAQLGKERLRRALNVMRQGRGKQDLGFRVLEFTSSALQPWQEYTGHDSHQLEILFDAATSPLVEGWQPENLLVEIQLLEGVPLDSTVTQLEELKENCVKRVESEACAHKLYVCLDQKVKDDTIERLAMEPQDVFICLDSALTDEAKLRLSDRFNLRII